MEAREIVQLGGLFFEHIEEGFERYDHELISDVPEKLYSVIQNEIERNGWDYCFVDFYYGRLQEEEKARIRQVVPQTMQRQLELYEKSENIYFSLTKELLELTWFLTSKEYLFSTYYFCKYPCTIWGNYNHSLVVFRKKDKVLA